MTQSGVWLVPLGLDVEHQSSRVYTPQSHTSASLSYLLHPHAQPPPTPNDTES